MHWLAKTLAMIVVNSSPSLPRGTCVSADSFTHTITLKRMLQFLSLTADDSRQQTELRLSFLLKFFHFLSVQLDQSQPVIIQCFGTSFWKNKQQQPTFKTALSHTPTHTHTFCHWSAEIRSETSHKQQLLAIQFAQSQSCFEQICIWTWIRF